MLGIILIQKELGRTSHDVVDSVRRKLGIRRVGHAGTLDPLATGLLVVAVGPATRFLQYLPLEPKEYVAEITFGKATSTYDMEGEVIHEGQVPENLSAAIEQEISRFKGLISQLPPMYSAVKKDGKPLYQYARQGKEIEREPRNVHIDAFDITVKDERTVDARIVCSGGTYIRSLAHDLGMTIGCGAHLSKLHRTKVGRFTDEMATKIEDIRPDLLVSLKEALPPMPLLQMNEAQVLHIREGRQVSIAESLNRQIVGSSIENSPDRSSSPPLRSDDPAMDDSTDGSASRLVGLLDTNGEVFSVARVRGNVLQPECVIPLEAFHVVP